MGLFRLQLNLLLMFSNGEHVKSVSPPQLSLSSLHSTQLSATCRFIVNYPYTVRMILRKTKTSVPDFK